MSNGPYFNTYLYTNVTLHPNQMNNDIYKHLKNNLIRKLQNKCYMNYGFVSKIYKIESRAGGQIIPEDPSASAVYKIKFSCKICRPLKNSTVVCEVVGINKSIIYLRNGPIYMLIFDGHINMNNFMYDDKRNVWIAYTTGDKGIPITKGTYVSAKIYDTRIEDKSDRILMLGILESIATKQEIDKIIEMRENDDDKYIEYEDYIKDDNIVVQEHTPTENNESSDKEEEDEKEEEEEKEEDDDKSSVSSSESGASDTSIKS